MGIFLKEEDNYISDFYLKNGKVLDSGTREPEANKQRNKLYAELINHLKSLNPDDPKTVEQVKDKIQYLKSRAKNKNALRKKSRRRTGGGKGDGPKLTDIDDKMISALGSTAGFSVIEGSLENGAPADYGSDKDGGNRMDNGDDALDLSDDNAKSRSPESPLPTGTSKSSVSFSSPLFSTVNFSPSVDSADVFLKKYGVVEKSSTSITSKTTSTVPKGPSAKSTEPKKQRESLLLKKKQYLNLAFETRQLTKEVLEAQLQAAQSTMETNTKIQEFLATARPLLETMQSYFQREQAPVMFMVQPASASSTAVEATADTSLVSGGYQQQGDKME